MDSTKRGWIGGFIKKFHFKNLRKNHHLQPKIVSNGEKNNEQLIFNIIVKMEKNIKNKQKKNEQSKIVQGIEKRNSTPDL